MPRCAWRVLFATLFVLFVGCSGEGCTSGCSCAGVSPIAGGFEPERRVENALSVRMTSTGLGFLSQNAASLAGLLLGEDANGGVITFEIPSVSGDLGCFVIGKAGYSICQGGADPGASPPQCTAEIDLGNAALTITTDAPHNVLISGSLPIRVQQLPVSLDVDACAFVCPDLCTNLFEISPNLTLNGNDTCPGQVQTFQDIGLNANVSIEIDTDPTHSRFGFSRVRVSVNASDGNIVDGLKICTGTSLGDDLLNALFGLVGNLIVSPLEEQLNGAIEDAVCLQANEAQDPPCPIGTSNVNGVCRFGTTPGAECASFLLGTDGAMDLSGALSLLSPATKGIFEFLMAAGGHTLRDDGSGHHWGDLNPVNGGATVGIYGGVDPIEISQCVPSADLHLADGMLVTPKGIPIPDELLSNTVAGWPEELPGPHVGFALSERFTNYLLGQAYLSGALCMGLTAEALGDNIPLSTSLVGVGLGASSMNELGRLKKAASIAIVLRPTQPPQVNFGHGTDLESDPLVRIDLPRISFDFYVWSLDRYVRAMTATMDLAVPANLIVTPEGLQPVIESLQLANTTVTGSSLLREDPAKIAAALEGLLSNLVGTLLGDALPALDLNEQLADLGLSLDIPPTVDGKGSPGLVKLTKGSDDFLGIFAGLGLGGAAQSQAASLRAPEVSQTTAELVDLEVDPAGLRLSTLDQSNGPRATIRLGSSLDDGTRAVEWQYKLDRGAWHPFTRSRHITVQDEWLRNQGEHVVHVRSRLVGQVHSLDPEPVQVLVRVDVDPPAVAVEQRADGALVVHAHDAVSGAVGTGVRVRLGDLEGDTVTWRAWSSWQAADGLAALPADGAAFIEVEATDAEGNLGTVMQPLIRGRGQGEGCECRAAAPPTGSRGLWALAWVVLALAARRRRRWPVPRLP